MGVQGVGVGEESERRGGKKWASGGGNGRLGGVQVRRVLREQGVAEFKVADRVECVASLPLTPVGKVEKKQLRQRLASRSPPFRRKRYGHP